MKNLSKRELEAYCGDLSQAFGIQECVLEGGKAKGTKAYIVNNGCGLEMTVLADKCFAIPKMSFKGDNVGFISKTGICAPEFFQEEDTRGFLRNFEAGFLTTCGLTYVGTPGCGRRTAQRTSRSDFQYTDRTCFFESRVGR